MGTMTDTGRTRAEESFLEAIECASAGLEKYPAGTAFVDAQRLAEFAPMVVRYAREHRPVVLVYPDGDERLLVPPIQLSKFRIRFPMHMQFTRVQVKDGWV